MSNSKTLWQCDVCGDWGAFWGYFGSLADGVSEGAVFICGDDCQKELFKILPSGRERTGKHLARRLKKRFRNNWSKEPSDD